MAYTTTPIANRLGYNRGWQNQLLPWIPNLTDVASITYLKSYLLVKEYLRFYQINLLSLNIKSLTKSAKLIHIFIYKHVRYKRTKNLPFFSQFQLTKKNNFLIAHQLNKYKIQSINMLYPLKINNFKLTQLYRKKGKIQRPIRNLNVKKKFKRRFFFMTKMNLLSTMA